MFLEKLKRCGMILTMIFGILLASTMTIHADEYTYQAVTVSKQTDVYVPYILLAPTGTSTNDSSAWHRVFCFNKKQNTPGEGDYRATGMATRYRQVAGTTENFNLFADTPRLYGDDNRTHIMSIIYHVYKDPSFNAYGVSKEHLDTIVQLAIWYYTDSYDVQQYQGSSNWWAFNMSYAEKALYNDLISVSIPDIASKLTLYLYTSDESNRQNLIDIGDITPEQPKTAGVELKVYKKDSDTKELLAGASFKIVKGYVYSTYTTNEQVTEFTTTADGPSSVTLVPGQYTIIETQAPDGYELSASVYRLDVKDKEIYDATMGYTPIKADDGLVIYNTQQTKSLSLTKLVEGTGGDKNQYFTFDITLTKADGSGYSGELSLESGDKMTFTDGHATISLKDNDKITVLGIPESLSYTVTEQPTDNYTTSIAINGNIPQEQSEVSGKLSDSDTTDLIFTNTNNIVPPTGIRDHLGIYMMLFGCVLVGTILFLKRQH